MCKNRLMTIFSLLYVVLTVLTSQHTFASSNNDPVKEVVLEKEKDTVRLRIIFRDEFHFTPRIHVNPKGVKVLLSFNKSVDIPKTHCKSTDIVKGYFFERFGPASLMFIAVFQDDATFVKKTYTKNAVNIVFKVHHKPTIVIDAGHGGKDKGTTGVNGEEEKNLTLTMSLELKKLIEQTGNYHVVLVRDKDEFLSLEQRMDKIKHIRGDLLISIHADNNLDKTLSGMSVYTLPSLKKITNPGEVSYNSKKSIQQYYDVLFKSRRFAGILVKYIPDKYLIHSHPCRNSELKILKNQMASVLIEVGYISNSKNACYLRSKKFRNKINCAIVYAVNAYFDKPKTGSNE